MKAIYTDEPVCGEENLRMRERMARLQGKKADEENGEPSAEDDPAPEEGLAELLEGLDLSPEQREQLRADMLEHLAETIAGDADDEDDPDEPDEPDGEEH